MDGSGNPKTGNIVSSKALDGRLDVGGELREITADSALKPFGFAVILISLSGIANIPWA